MVWQQSFQLGCKMITTEEAEECCVSHVRQILIIGWLFDHSHAWEVPPVNYLLFVPCFQTEEGLWFLLLQWRTFCCLSCHLFLPLTLKLSYYIFVPNKIHLSLTFPISLWSYLGESTACILCGSDSQGWCPRISILTAISPLNLALNWTRLELGQQLHFTGARIFEIKDQGRN